MSDDPVADARVIANEALLLAGPDDPLYADVAASLVRLADDAEKGVLSADEVAKFIDNAGTWLMDLQFREGIVGEALS